MTDAKDNILVWLPSPMGDAILCTPALRAIRRRFGSSRITFFGSGVVRKVLSPCAFADAWLEQDDGGVLATAGVLRREKFTQVILFKNSFGSALICWLAGIPVRIGYAREGRGILLTEKLQPMKLPSGGFKPISMVDYYLTVASWLGADVQDRGMELAVEPKDFESLRIKLPQVFDLEGPLVIIVPGAAAGPSKRWPAERFTEVADRITADYNATVVVSVAPNETERQIARQITDAAKQKLVSLADVAISLGELKALYAGAKLVICNDTGPRHIAIALKRKVITLVGPNNPEWTDPSYDDEVFVKGEAPCAPCDRSECRQSSHLCMESITVEMVCRAAAEALNENEQVETDNAGRDDDISIGEGQNSASEIFFVESAYKSAFERLGLDSVDSVFAFEQGRNLGKANLASYRSRIEVQIESPATVIFLKRYDRPSISAQIKNWLSAKRRVSCAFAEFDAARNLASLGVNTPKVVAWGQRWGMLFEKRSFIASEKVPAGESLERKLPEFFNGPDNKDNLKLRREFILQLAAFVRKFHDTGYRHRDLYLCHIFRSGAGRFYLIDLARAFRPGLFGERFRIKDITQLHYSAPGGHFSRADRLRFFLAYIGHSKLSSRDKKLIRKIANKAGKMARHDTRHGRGVPFAI